MNLCESNRCILIFVSYTCALASDGVKYSISFGNGVVINAILFFDIAADKPVNYLLQLYSACGTVG